jgi:hypothetical protein
MSVQREPALAGAREQYYGDGYRTSTPMHLDRCSHRFLSVEPVVSKRVEGGYVGRCLLCEATGPARDNGEDARRVLLEQMVGKEQ